MRYLLDEHIDPVLRRELLRATPDLEVWIIGDPGAPPHGTLDPEILIWCKTNAFCLVTNNRRSMPRHLADHLDLGRHVPGIFVVNLSMNFGQIIDELLLIAGAFAFRIGSSTCRSPKHDLQQIATQELHWIARSRLTV